MSSDDIHKHFGRFVAGDALREQIFSFALRVHYGQTDKAGKSYIGHIMRVAERAAQDGGLKCWMAAMLHDVLEDTPTTVGMLRSIEVPCDVIEAVRLVSKNHNKGDYHKVYLANIKGNEIARIVKMADFVDNMNLSRLSVVGEADIKRQEKYVRGYRFLMMKEDS